MDGGGERVVGALSHIHMVVGVDRLLRSKAVLPQNFNRAIADDFVHVHVARSSRAGLVNVNRKLIVEFSIGDFGGSIDQRFDLLIIQRIFSAAGELSDVAVRMGGGQLDLTHGMNQTGRQCIAGDLKILNGPLRLCAVVRFCWNLYFTHRITFGSKPRHGLFPVSFKVVNCECKKSRLPISGEVGFNSSKLSWFLNRRPVREEKCSGQRL